MFLVILSLCLCLWRDQSSEVFPWDTGRLSRARAMLLESSGPEIGEAGPCVNRGSAHPPPQTHLPWAVAFTSQGEEHTLTTLAGLTCLVEPSSLGGMLAL